MRKSRSSRQACWRSRAWRRRACRRRLLALGRLAVDEQAEALLEAQRLGVGQLLLFGEGARHAG